ncbi:MAG: LapA family protein [Candidatus Krumholzibacteriota bacterium]|nr:LapA family protein [Candidatus Krumholzibacteriota bacterium]
MWIIRGIVLLIGAIGIIWLGTENAGTKVTFYFFNHTLYDVTLNLVIITSFISGMIIWAVGSWIREMQLLLRLRKGKKERRKLLDEISELRNIPLNEEPLDKDELIQP